MSEIVLKKSLYDELLAKINWKELSCSSLSNEFIEAFEDKLDIGLVMSHSNVSKAFVRKHSDKVNLLQIIKRRKVSEEFLREFYNKIVEENLLQEICKYQIVSESFVEDIVKYLSPSDLYEFECNFVSESFVRRNANKINWGNVCRSVCLSENFMREFDNKLKWMVVSRYQKLSEQFMDDYADKLCWANVFAYQKLSEAFLRKHVDKDSWSLIAVYQKLSEPFIIEFMDRFASMNMLKDILKYQVVSCELFNSIKRFEYYADTSSKWSYASKEVKLNALKNISHYEIIDDEYIVAYKMVRLDNYSHYNFQYKYEVGQEYEAHCNCHVDEENSFGLSAWTKEKAILSYDNGKLLKVHIDIDDIGVIIPERDYKIRAKKFKVISEEPINK